MNHPQLNTQVKTIHDLCPFYRGQILDYIIWIEEKVDVYLWEYFFNNSGYTRKMLDPINDGRKDEFLEFFSSKLGLNISLRFNALVYLLEKNCREELKKCKQKDKKPQFISDIRTLIEYRNVWAHSKIESDLCNFEKREIVLKHPDSVKNRMNPKNFRSFYQKYSDAIDDLDSVASELLKKGTMKQIKREE